MTDQEVIEYIKSHLKDYDKAFSSKSTLIGFYVELTPELEEWAKATIEANTGKKFAKTFLDDLADPLSQDFPEAEEDDIDEPGR